MRKKTISILSFGEIISAHWMYYDIRNIYISDWICIYLLIIQLWCIDQL